MADPPPLTFRAPTAPADFDSGSVLFIGTATVLIRYGGFTVLTDPNFLHAGSRVHLGYGVHATRLTDPALELTALPPFDLVVLSHMHEDHFDRKVARELDRFTPIVTTRHAAKALVRKGFRRAIPIATWGTQTAVKGNAKLRITAMPGKHAPGLLSKLLPPVIGTMLEVARGDEAPAHRMYITGDTILYPGLRKIHDRYPDIDLALLHLGGTRIMGMTVTMTGDDGAELLKMVGPRAAIPIHYDDYDRFKSKLADFERAVLASGRSDRVFYLKRGEEHHFDLRTAHVDARAGHRPQAPGR